jgi:hypothetical protein
VPQFLDPFPDRWRASTLAMVKSETGHAGIMTLAGVTIYVRGWRRLESGEIAFECQHATDAEMEAYAAQLVAKLGV